MRAPKPLPADIAEWLHYDAETGVLTWRVSGGRTVAGEVAGTPTTFGYRQIQISGQKYMAHRIAWALAYGDPGDMQIDHSDGDRSNNKLDNLRLATHADNMRNAVHASNTSGHVGVSWSKRHAKWLAQIRVGGHPKCLGTFDKIEDAAAAYRAAAELHHGPFAAHRRAS